MGSTADRQPSRPIARCSIEWAAATTYNPSMTRYAAVRRRWQVYCAWAVLLFFLSNSCSSVGAPFIPAIGPPAEDEETRISREFRREAKKHFRFVNNPEVERYIDRIGRRILTASGPQSYDYRFFVIEDGQLNAFAVPGGSVFMFTGMIERAKSTDELAGVLGHEITHIKGRHMARSSGPDAMSVLSLLTIALLARGGGAAQAAGIVGQAVSATRQAAFSRQLEMESDTLGARYMAAAGYDPKGVIGFLKTMEQERARSPIDVPAYIMSHPITQERLANAELVVRSLGQTQPRADDPESLKKVQIIIKMERPNQDTVVNEYEKLLLQNPQDPASLHLLGFVHQLQGQFAKAQVNYERSRQLRPDNAGLQRDLGRLYGQVGAFDAARIAFERTIALDPNEPLTYLYFGEMLEKAGDLRGAAGAYLNAQNLAPLWDRPPQRLGLVYGKLDRRGDGYYYLGRSFLLQDEDEKAIADVERAIKIIGENSPRGQVIKEELKLLRSRKR